MTEGQEIWAWVPGFEDRYQVSTFGRVRSFVRHAAGKILRPGPMASGHLSVVLGRAVGSRCVHRLVLEAFVGPRPVRHEARHLDGDPANNKISNLEWATRGRNVQDKKWHKGPSSFHKLTAERALELKTMLAGGAKQREAAKTFGVSRSLVAAIAVGKVHADV